MGKQTGGRFRFMAHPDKRARPVVRPAIPPAGKIKAGLDEIRRLAAADGPPGQTEAILKEAEAWINSNGRVSGRGSRSAS